MDTICEPIQIILAQRIFVYFSIFHGWTNSFIRYLCSFHSPFNQMPYPIFTLPMKYNKFEFAKNTSFLVRNMKSITYCYLFEANIINNRFLAFFRLFFFECSKFSNFDFCLFSWQ